ncbi:MAG: sugar phosphate isomerase/epimerase, partial [Oscillospiraceae bacterium]|nr:sugar phosphate isomerase/epimerase [Oscillospiraceae bacterium]
MLKIGLILYSVRDMMALDPLGTVDAVAKMGYKNIEVCNHNALEDAGCGFGIPAETLKEKLDEYGSRVISAHVEPMMQADLDGVIAYEQVLGNRNLVFPMGRIVDYDDLMRQIEWFNATGKRLKEEGMQLLYHNHYHEYRTYKGKTVLDYIVDNTDPDYLGLELDTFWTMRGGRDPVEVLKHFGKRIKL